MAQREMPSSPPPSSWGVLEPACLQASAGEILCHRGNGFVAPWLVAQQKCALSAVWMSFTAPVLRDSQVGDGLLCLLAPVTCN